MAWTPTADQVGRIIARLTTDDNADITGTWTDTTVPTKAQVESIITDAYNALSGSYIGLNSVSLITTGLEPLAQSVVAWQAAYDVAMSFYPQMDDLLDKLEKRVALARADLASGVDRSQGHEPDDGTGNDNTPDPATPSGYYPEAGPTWTW